MLTILKKTASRAAMQQRWMACLLLMAGVSSSAASHGGSPPGLFGCGATSGKLAKVAFCLRESFPPTSVAWSPDGRYIAVGSTMDPRIDVWDVARRKIIKVILRTYPSVSFHDMTWGLNGRYLAFCDAGGVARVYNVGAWSEAHSLVGPRAFASCIQTAFSGDSKRIAVLGTRYLGVFSVPGWRVIKLLQLDVGWGLGDHFATLAYMPDTHTVLVAGSQYISMARSGKRDTWESWIWFFNENDSVPSRSLRPYPAGGQGKVYSVVTSPEGENIVTEVNTGAGNSSAGFVDQSVHILRAADGQLIAAPLDGLRPLKFSGGLAIAYTHDGHYIVVPHNGGDGWIHILDGRTFKVLDLVRSNAFNYDVAVNRMSDAFAVGSNKSVIVWSLPTG